MKLAKGLKITALVLMSLLTAFFLFMGIGEMVGGDFSGIGHLFPVVLVIFMMWLGWKKPFASGIFLLLVGFLYSIPFFIRLNRAEGTPFALNIIAAPIFLFGLLFLTAGILERKNQKNDRHL
jgi:hypothetical protein